MAAALLVLLLCAAPVPAARLSPSGPLDPLAAHEDFFETTANRKCLDDVVRDWPRVRETFRCAARHRRLCTVDAAKRNHTDTVDAMLADLADIWAAEEELKVIRDSKGAIGKGIQKVQSLIGGSLEITRLNNHIAAGKDRLEMQGFSYERALQWCAEGYDATFRLCLDAALEERASILPGSSSFRSRLRSSVPVYLDLTQYDFCRSRAEGGMKLREAELTESDEMVRINPFWKDVKDKCKQEAFLERMAIFDFLQAQLQVGKEVDGECLESPDHFCPEGTYAVTKRTLTAKKGTKAFTHTLAVTKAISVGAFMSAGIANGGAAGAAAGFLSGFSFPVPLFIAFAASFYASMGPRTCGCFPLDCIVDDRELGTCRLGAEPGDAGRNPFRNAAPFMSTKCIEVPGKERCALMHCAAEDYARKLDYPGLSGTVGRRPEDRGYYNCLSADGRVTGDISASPTLADGKANTAAAKAELFRQLGVSGALAPTAPEALPENSK